MSKLTHYEREALRRKSEGDLRLGEDIWQADRSSIYNAYWEWYEGMVDTDDESFTHTKCDAVYELMRFLCILNSKHG